VEKNNMCGKILYWWSDKFENFEFEIEYSKGKWYPMQNGILPSHDTQTGESILGVDTHWKELPKSTHVGCHGGMINWYEIAGLIYWN
jgi:hypothetical protein